MTTNDACDAVTLLQPLVGSTFDSSLLVLTACTGLSGSDGNEIAKIVEEASTISSCSY